MKKTTLTLFFLLGFKIINAQNATEITNIQTPQLEETSGLLFYNNTLITHNDSGDNANLYEISTTTGMITRTIVVKNATNIDWEDITQDASFIYIGDIGNNNGNRTDLKIYKIDKNDYNDSDDMVTPEVISYSYANQSDFTSNVNNNNWDAEGLISYGEKLLIFSKNWVDKKVNVYSIPKTSGTHSANLESSFNSNGLITGADISSNETEIYLTGYSSTEAPFMYTLHNLPNNSLDIFSGTTSSKITNIVPLGNQVEAIALFEITPTKHRLYISNEKFTFSSGPVIINFPAKLWNIEIDAATILNTQDITADSSFSVYPNPFNEIIKLSKKVDKIVIFDVAGRTVAKKKYVKEISLESLNKGFYFAQIKIGNILLVRKIIKK